MDFMHDQLATGRKLRVLTIVDTFSRFSPALEPRFSFRGVDVVEVLERVGREIGLPATIRVDQGQPRRVAVRPRPARQGGGASRDRVSALATNAKAHQGSLVPRRL